MFYLCIAVVATIITITISVIREAATATRDAAELARVRLETIQIRHAREHAVSLAQRQARLGREDGNDAFA